jgi:hypothetical protein
VLNAYEHREKDLCAIVMASMLCFRFENHFMRTKYRSDGIRVSRVLHKEQLGSLRRVSQLSKHKLGTKCLPEFLGPQTTELISGTTTD